MEKLVIVGAGGHGRCCLDIARETYDEIVFLDDSSVNQTINDCKVIGTIDQMEALYPEYSNIFIAIGNNEVRSKIYQQAKRIGYDIVTLISEQATISKYAFVDTGCVIFPHAVIEPNAKIGKNCIICVNVTVNHDATIHDHCLINTGSVIRPNVILGCTTHISSGCLITQSLDEGTFIKDGGVVI